MVLALHRATHATLHVLAIRLAGLNLSASEINVLANLADGRNRSVGEIASDTATKPTTLTSVLDRLERRGLPDPRPRPGRPPLIPGVADRGRPTHRGAARSAAADLEHAALAGVSDADLAGFRAVTRALTEVPR